MGMDVALRRDLGAGHSHQQRLAIAHQLVARILTRHGHGVAAIVLFGSTAVDADGLYSDLDLTVVTHEDLATHFRCYPYQGHQINLDYQTVEESFAETREPHGGGCWLTCVPLYDPAELTQRLVSAYRALGPQECQEAFLHIVREELSTWIGKVRNAVAAADRASFLHASCGFSEAAFRGLCMVNGNHAMPGNTRLINEVKSPTILPPRFAELIDVISGAVAASDQRMYDSVEGLWEGLVEILEQRSLRWQESDLPI